MDSGVVQHDDDGRIKNEGLKGLDGVLEDTTEEEEEEICAICLDVLDENDNTEGRIVTQIDCCKHCYHDQCIRSWIAQNCVCPQDRLTITSICNSNGFVKVESFARKPSSYGGASQATSLYDSINCYYCETDDSNQELYLCDTCDSKGAHFLCDGLQQAPAEDEFWHCIVCRTRTSGRLSKYLLDRLINSMQEARRTDTIDRNKVLYKSRKALLPQVISVFLSVEGDQTFAKSLCDSGFLKEVGYWINPKSVLETGNTEIECMRFHLLRGCLQLVPMLEVSDIRMTSLAFQVAKMISYVGDSSRNQQLAVSLVQAFVAKANQQKARRDAQIKAMKARFTRLHGQSCTSSDIQSSSLSLPGNLRMVRSSSTGLAEVQRLLEREQNASTEAQQPKRQRPNPSFVQADTQQAPEETFLETSEKKTLLSNAIRHEIATLLQSKNIPENQIRQESKNKARLFWAAHQSSINNFLDPKTKIAQSIAANHLTLIAACVGGTTESAKMELEFYS